MTVPRLLPTAVCSASASTALNSFEAQYSPCRLAVCASRSPSPRPRNTRYRADATRYPFHRLDRATSPGAHKRTLSPATLSNPFQLGPRFIEFAKTAPAKSSGGWMPNAASTDRNSASSASPVRVSVLVVGGGASISPCSFASATAAPVRAAGCSRWRASSAASRGDQ